MRGSTWRRDAAGNLGGTVTGPLHEATDVLDCGNAGTGMRLLAGVVAGIDGLAVLTGDASLRRRPMGRVAEPAAGHGRRASTGATAGRLPPLVIRGGHLRGITWESPVASAQVKSCLLLAGLRADGTTTVRSPGPQPRPHRAPAGPPRRHRRDRRRARRGRVGQPGDLRGDRVDVSGDPSSAAFWLVAGAIAGTAVTLPGVCVNPGRTGMVDVLADLGADITLADRREVCGEPVADLRLAAGSLDGGAEVAGDRVVDAIDELPVLAVAGAMSRGGLVVRDAAELRVKESDRIDGIAAVFAALGLHGRDPSPTASPSRAGSAPPAGAGSTPHGDHRIAMTAAIGATVARAPVEIAGFEAVPTSYPSFLEHLIALGGHVDALQETP